MALSEALKINTTLMNLNICSIHKKKFKWHPRIIRVFLFYYLTGNNIGDTGATDLSEALRMNTTLTKLDFSCLNKKKDIKEKDYFMIVCKNTIGNKIWYSGATSLGESLRTNTTLAYLDLHCKF